MFPYLSIRALSIFEIVILPFFTLDASFKSLTCASALLSLFILYLQDVDAVCLCSAYALVLHGTPLMVFCSCWLLDVPCHFASVMIRLCLCGFFSLYVVCLPWLLVIVSVNHLL